MKRTLEFLPSLLVALALLTLATCDLFAAQKPGQHFWLLGRHTC